MLLESVRIRDQRFALDERSITLNEANAVLAEEFGIQHIPFDMVLYEGEKLRLLRRFSLDENGRFEEMRIEGVVVVPVRQHKLVYNSDEGSDPVGVSAVMGTYDRESYNGSLERVFMIQQRNTANFMRAIGLLDKADAFSREVHGLRDKIFTSARVIRDRALEGLMSA